MCFMIENNQYAGFAPLRGHTGLKTLSDRAKAHAIPGITIDGNNVWGVYMTVRDMARRVREGEGPLLIGAVTYRQCGHTEGEMICTS